MVAAIKANGGGALEKRVAEAVEELRATFESGHTRSYKWRIEQVKGMAALVQAHKKEIFAAVHADLHKPELEADLTEMSCIDQEIQTTLRNLKAWMAPEQTKTPALLLPARCEVRRDPYGVVLVIAPFNYPFQLAVVPVLNALAAGNTVLLKPSELTPQTSALLARLLPAYLDPKAVKVVEGAVPETQALLAQRWDLIFFTGSEAVGKIVHQAAAQHLTPCILELGGKSPVFIDQSVRDIQLAARRVVWGKLVNAGQTCIAPDYVLCHHSRLPAFLEAAKAELSAMYEAQGNKKEDTARIVSERHAQRLAELLKSVGAAKGSEEKIEAGGDVDVKARYISPTIVSGVTPESRLMQEEIFGPILPVLGVSSAEEAIGIIRRKPNPLALYVFAHDERVCDYVTNAVPSGGVCLNDTLMHFACGTLPFGGIAGSGLGQYHGRFSFEAFTHVRGVLSRWDHWLGDVPSAVRYAPYTPLKHKLFRLLTDSLLGVAVHSSLSSLAADVAKGGLMLLGLVFLLQTMNQMWASR